MADEITIESITSTVETPEALSGEQKTFLTEHAAELEDDVATKYGITKPEKKIEPEVRPGEEPVVPPKKDEEEIDPDDEARISKLVDKKVAPLQAQLVQRTNEAEADTFLRSPETLKKYPDASKYREAMLKYMNHPAYSRIPASNVFRIVAGDDLVKLGAQREREAAIKVKGTQVNSSSARVPQGQKDWGNASREEFEAKRAEVLGRSS